MTINISDIRKAEQLSHPQYRAAIDGLRAVAVLSVVGFHAFPSWIRGGFVGVDIFFVNSGFLISTIIFGSLERNCFSFTEFYVRRIRRIFPALLLVLLASMAVGWFALFAEEYKRLGKHVAGGAGFISNFVFWKESGYFDNATGTKPLQHLWSLGIEEQFYIAWPLLLWCAWKLRLNLLAITIVVGIISFLWNVGQIHNDPLAAFYSPQTRVWELLVGSSIAYVTLHKESVIANCKAILVPSLGSLVDAKVLKTSGETVRNVQSLLGATLIAIAVLVTTNGASISVIRTLILKECDFRSPIAE